MTREQVSEYLATRWAAFEDLGPLLISQRHRAAVVAAHAREAGQEERYLQARAMIGEISGQYDDWTRTRERWQSLRNAMGLGAWPVVPLAWAAVALAIAASAVYLFGRAGANETALELLERGIITPAEAEALGLDLSKGRWTWLADAAKWVAVAAGTGLLLGSRGRRG